MEISTTQGFYLSLFTEASTPNITTRPGTPTSWKYAFLPPKGNIIQKTFRRRAITCLRHACLPLERLDLFAEKSYIWARNQPTLPNSPRNRRYNLETSISRVHVKCSSCLYVPDPAFDPSPPSTPLVFPMFRPLYATFPTAIIGCYICTGEHKLLH